MNLNFWTLLIVCPLVFAGSLLDAVAGGEDYSGIHVD